MIVTESNEVAVRPGRCIAWRCNEPAEGLACPAHAKDFGVTTVRDEYMKYLTDEEHAELNALPPKERAQYIAEYRQRLYMRMKRTEQPGYGHGNYVGNDDSLRNARRRVILAKLHEHGKVITTDLAAQFGISTAAVGRDLVAMDREGLCHRVYGGARLDGSDNRGVRSRA